jgi:DNA-binding transcriptional MerR regulator
MKLLAIPRRSAGNYRLYPPNSLDRVRLIRRALAVGFSLPELVRALKVRDAGGGPCRRVQISGLAAMRDHLRTVLEDWDQRLLRTPYGRPARLLESL